MTNKFSRGNLISIKAAFILFLVCLIAIPLLFVWSTIDNRHKRYNSAVQEISKAWSAPQQITGPILVLPYASKVTNKEGNTQEIIKTIAWLPESLDVAIKIEPELRYRGIFEAVVYRSNLEIKGFFRAPRSQDLAKLNLVPNADILWESANISLGLTDMRRLKAGLTLSWNDQILNFSPGSAMPELALSGIHAGSLNLKTLQKNQKIPFVIKLQIDGSEAMSFLPFGKDNHVYMESTWPHPSFTGAFLPEKREINSEGFKATWELSYFGRTYAQQFTSDQLNDSMKTALESSSFGVRFLQPVDAYRQSERSVKYGILFVIFTFIVYFLFEIITGARIHIFQYALVGIALCTFFLLLISLAEHIGFHWSYLLGALLIITQVSLYSLKVVKTLKRTAIVAAVLALLYAYLYAVLQLEDYALLIGASGLFLTLAVIMFAVRNVDWFSPEKS